MGDMTLFDHIDPRAPYVIIFSHNKYIRYNTYSVFIFIMRKIYNVRCLCVILLKYNIACRL